MKIIPISHSNIKFGYNKKLNNQLKAVLKTYPDREWANTLSALNNQCNSIENKLIKADREKDKNFSKYTDYLDIFKSLKEMLVAFVSVTFDNLHFADREYKQYEHEHKLFGSKSDDWRLSVCEDIYPWTDAKQINVEESNIPTSNIESNDKTSSDINPAGNANPSASEANPQNSTEPLKKTAENVSLLQTFVPSDESPKGFDDVSGMDKVKSELNNGILLSVKNPEQAILDFMEYGKKTPKGMLLYGPPGCGKTYITQALAMESGIPLYILDIGQLGSSFINKTSKNIKTAFDEAIKIANDSGKPCLLFMDEIDSLAFDRNSRTDNEDIKQVASLLQALDAAKQSNVFVIGATNKYNLLDPAIRRRFDSKIFVSIPDFDARKALLKKQLQGKSKAALLLSDENALDSISTMLNGFSNDSICKIVSSAAFNAMNRNRANISEQDFIKAISETSEEKPDVKSYLADNIDSKPKIGFSSN